MVVVVDEELTDTVDVQEIHTMEAPFDLNSDLIQNMLPMEY